MFQRFKYLCTVFKNVSKKCAIEATGEINEVCNNDAMSPGKISQKMASSKREGYGRRLYS